MIHPFSPKSALLDKHTDLKSACSKGVCLFASGPSAALCEELVGIIWFAALWANPYTFCVVDGVMARTAVRTHRKYSSAAAAHFALLRGSFLPQFAPLIFLSHTILNTTVAGSFAMNNRSDGEPTVEE